MGLFGFNKKKDKESCTWECHPETEKESAIKVLGSGCDKCRALEKSTRDALQELGRKERIQHVTDFAEIAQYGVMQTPALVVNNKVISYGKVLTKDEVIKLLQQ